MKKTKKQKQLFASLFLMGYVFLVFFSQLFHNHGNNDHYNDFNTVRKAFNKAVSDKGGGCLACHVLYESKHLAISDAVFVFYPPKYCADEKVQNTMLKHSTYTEKSFLRGPPINHFI